ncbi:hypothetical protein FNW02_37310 [Komarekiella sp. 'clone 1']|uniref:Uncharacterized protein n=1 Tax=Komarekiella delphini-convector SJRDD-AB1 TaxID=2593771 RepID=A0AA41BAJ6_9NOST|nr:hypothetical protein [Komarekiella delphini-convector]MBD6621207.1 hypothetical protein [Komarekiella delphini-convector SJRDD-AB1]
MAKAVNNYVERTSARLLRSLRRSGGSIPLHRIQFSGTIVQYLLDKKQVQVKNTGHGFLLAVIERF